MWYNELVSHGGWQGRKDKAMIGLAVKVAKSKTARKVAKVAVKKAAEHIEVKRVGTDVEVTVAGRRFSGKELLEAAKDRRGR